MDILQHRLVQAAIAGAVSAVAIDLAAFRKWTSVDDAMAYNWRLAAFRLIQGAVYGVLAALGVNATS